jgi:TRAP-type C4-dicarboxylate transport system permease small subunit
LRRFLDRLYLAAAVGAAVSLASIALVMLLQAGLRKAGLLLRGADDIVSWLCAAATFLALGYTFRQGELIRVGLLLDKLPARARRPAETACLVGALAVVGYATWAVAGFVYESWQLEEVAQGLLQVPIWIPQLSLVIGLVVFLVAVLDELVTHLRGRKTAYQAAQEARHASGDFSDEL